MSSQLLSPQEFETLANAISQAVADKFVTNEFIEGFWLDVMDSKAERAFAKEYIASHGLDQEWVESAIDLSISSVVSDPAVHKKISESVSEVISNMLISVLFGSCRIDTKVAAESGKELADSTDFYFELNEALKYR